MRGRLLHILFCALVLAGCERSPETLTPPVIVHVNVETGYDSLDFEVETEGSFIECGVFFGTSPETAAQMYGTRTETGFSLTVNRLEEGTEYWFQPFVSNGRENVRATGDYVMTKIYPFVRIPDPVFKAWLLVRFDTDGDGEISPQEARNVDVISCKEGKGARSLKGIEAFTSLYSLEWENDLLEELDLSQNDRLEWLHLNKNRLRSVELPKSTRLKDFWAEDNDIEYIDLSGFPNLQAVSMARTPLKKLILPENSRIESLWFYDAELREIDLSGCPMLKSLTIHGNNLSELDVSPCRQLTFLHCAWNDLTRMDLTGLSELRELYCEGNHNLGPVLDLTSSEHLYSMRVEDCPRLEEIWIKAGHVISCSIFKDDHTKIIEK